MGGNADTLETHPALPPMNPALGTGYSRLRTTRTVDCVACRTKTCGPRA